MKSVTTILKRLFPVNPNIPKHVLENARKRGIAVHEWIEKYNNYLINGGDEPIIPLEYLIYAEQYKAWVKEYKVTPLHCELKLSDGNLVGVIDMICQTKDDDLCLVDFKITNTYDIAYVTLQSSAYKHLAIHNDYVDIDTPQKLLHLSMNGSSYIDLDYRWDLFQKLMELEDFLDSKGGTKK